MRKEVTVCKFLLEVEAKLVSGAEQKIVPVTVVLSVPTSFGFS